MGYFVGITDTGFVGTGEVSAVTSYMPCHIFGDQMLIGTGVRAGFYLLYAAAIVGVLFGVDKQFRFWHGAWGVLALALFLSMFLNVADFNLIVIDYAVLIELVLWYPVYFVFTVLLRPALVVDGAVQKTTSDAELRARLQRHRDTAVTDLDVARARAYADVLKAFALHAAADDAGAEHDDAHAALSQAVHHYVSHWHEQIEVPQAGGEGDEEHDHPGAVTTVYNADLIDEMAAAPTRGDLDKLRDLYVAALVHSGRTVGSARAAEHEVAQLAADELRITRGARRPARALRHFLLAASYKDQLTAAVGLLVWSAYMFGTAALNWPLLHNGSKGGGQCDDVPTVYFVLAPKKPFADAGFATFLKVWTVGVVLVAVVTTAVALFILAVALVGPRGVGLVTRRRGGRGDKSLEAGGGGGQENVHGSAGYHPHRARGQHAQEVLTCLHQAEGRSAHHRYRGSSSRTTATPPLRFSVWNIPWALLLAVLLAVTVATAELTTHRQGPFNNVPLDFARPPLHETAEILAFLVGLYALVLTLLSVLGAAVAAFQSRRRSRHVASHGKHARGQEKAEARA